MRPRVGTAISERFAQCLRASLLRSLLCGALLQSAYAAAPARATLRYHFRQGSVFTVQFTETLRGTLAYSGFPLPIGEVTTGLEQATIEKVYADGAALFRFRFASLT